MQKHIPQCASGEGFSVEESGDSENNACVYGLINYLINFKSEKPHECATLFHMFSYYVVSCFNILNVLYHP